MELDPDYEPEGEIVPGDREHLSSLGFNVQEIG